MSKPAAKAPWEIAIEKLAMTVTASIAEARAEARAEAKKARAEAKAEAKKARAEAKARAAEADKRAEERAAKAAEETAELRRIMNVHSAEEGEILEHEVAAAIIGNMSIGGVKFDRVITNSFVHGVYGNGEFDWIGVNGKVIFVGETRLTLKRDDVRRFATDRIALFKRASPFYVKGRAVQAVMIYHKARSGAVEEALKLKVKVFRTEDTKTFHPVETLADIPKRTQTKIHKRG